MADKVNALAERKRELLARSELYRQSLESEFRNIETATAWVPKTIGIVRAAYPVLMVAAPLLGYAFARKKRRSSNGEASTSRGIIASTWAGYKLFRKFKPVWDQLRSWRS
jgi:hypothetical protein